MSGDIVRQTAKQGAGSRARRVPGPSRGPASGRPIASPAPAQAARRARRLGSVELVVGDLGELPNLIDTTAIERRKLTRLLRRLRRPSR